MARVPTTSEIAARAGLAILVLAVTADAAVRVEVTGVGGDPARNVRALLTLYQARSEALSEWEIRRLHGRAPAEIARALEPWGHYRTLVESELIRDGDTWVARYRIAPGERVIVSEVSVRLTGAGAEDPGFNALAREFPLRTGQPLFHPAYEEGKASLAAFAAEFGYLDARFTVAQVTVDVESSTAAIEVVMDTGPRFRLGGVTFNQDAIEDRILAGYVTFEPGDPFTNQALLDLQTRLGATPYFQRVEVVPRRDLADAELVPVEVHAVARRPWGWDLGAGFGTDTGPRGNVALDGRRINRLGHRGRVEAMASEIEQSVSARYLVPLPAWRDGLLTFSAGWADLSPGTADTETFLLGASLGRARGRWRETVALTYQRELFTVGVDTGRATLLLPSIAWTRLSADDPTLPRRGYRLDLRLRGASDGAASDASFAQASVDVRLVQPLGPRSRLLLRAAGGTTATDAFRRLPPSVRFFAGGDASVRGFGYRSLGPVDREGTVIGGEHLAVAGIEVDTIVYEKWGRWGVAAFFDTGTAFSGSDFSPARGAGVGLRWVSPVGMMRLDVAWPLSETHRPPRLHFSLGGDL